MRGLVIDLEIEIDISPGTAENYLQGQATGLDEVIKCGPRHIQHFSNRIT